MDYHELLFFARLLGIKRALSTAFHLETDGQTERCHRTIEQILRYFVYHQQTKWEDYLDQAEFAYNRAKHSSTGFALFFAMYGYNPKMDFPKLTEDLNDMANVHAEHMRALEKTLRAAIARIQ